MSLGIILKLTKLQDLILILKKMLSVKGHNIIEIEIRTIQVRPIWKTRVEMKFLLMKVIMIG